MHACKNWENVRVSRAIIGDQDLPTSRFLTDTVPVAEW